MANAQPIESNEDSIKVVISTYPDAEKAKATGKELIQKGIAACVNIVPISTSLYFWEDKVVEDTECYLIAKCLIKKSDAVISFIKESHPYSTPFIGSSNITCHNPAYRQWMSQSLSLYSK